MADQPPASTDRPNLLLLFPDQWRGDWLGCQDGPRPYGAAPVATPNIDRLAQRGTRFRRLYTNSPVCAPARACLALGNARHRTGVWHNHDDTDPAETTLFNRLQAAGYRTLTCGKNDLHKRSDDYNDTGWAPRLAAYGFCDAIDQRGKMNAGRAALHAGGAYLTYLRDHDLAQAHYDDYAARQADPYTYATAPWPTPLPRHAFTDDFCGRCALELLDRTPRDQPWCLWVNFPGPHDPHDPPRELQQRYDDVDFPPPVNGEAEKNGQPIDHTQLRRNYAADCQGIDDWVGWIIDAVEQRGELENTIVIFFSDHGEMLGDHGRWAKCTWYEPSVHVPLIVAGPGIKAGQVSDALVELTDVHATCLELAGAPVPDGLDTRSFAPVLRGEADAHRDAAVSALDNWRMITDERWKLVRQVETDRIRNVEPTILIDRAADGAETTNVAVQHADVVARLSKTLDERSPTDLRPRNGAIAF